MDGSPDCVVTAETSTENDRASSPGPRAAMSAAALGKRAYDRGSLYTLALGTFAVGTEAFMITAILPQIARSLGTTVGAAGQLVTIFALTYALSSPLLTALTAAWPRRRLLMLSLAGFAGANLIAVAAPGYWFLAAARILLALAAGLYVPNANAVAKNDAESAIADKARKQNEAGAL